MTSPATPPSQQPAARPEEAMPTPEELAREMPDHYEEDEAAGAGDESERQQDA